MTVSLRTAALGVALGVGVLMASTASAAPLNLVTNGDFSAGATGFTTTYTLVDPTVPLSCWDPETYTVWTTTSPCHPIWVTSGDHTTGTGNYMIVNGRVDASGTVWEQTINGIAPDTDYFAEAFLRNLCCTDSNRPGSNLLFYVNDILIGTGGIGLPGVWGGVSNVWHSGSATSAKLRIENMTTVYDGNDFAIDDIYFGTESSIVPEPGTIALLLAGLPLAEAARRRRAARRNADKT